MSMGFYVPPEQLIKDRAWILVIVGHDLKAWIVQRIRDMETPVMH